MKLLLLLALLGGVAKGGTVYVKSGGAKLFAKASGSTVLKTLEAGQPVIWQGPDATKKAMHRVEVNGVTGYVREVDLTAKRPTVPEANLDAPPEGPQSYVFSQPRLKLPGGPSEEQTRAQLLQLRASTLQAAAQ